MSGYTWWGVPTHIGEGAELVGLTDTFTGERVFREADPLTVRFRRVCIREDHDGFLRGNNDLVVVSTYQFGKAPPVQRLHFMRSDVPVGCEGNFFDDFVLSIRDFQDSILTLRL